ncbi:MAG: tetratricopeptide repeat protein [Cytophagales bacterium]|nr:tetratricopeptide repeat protein [Cytophagales bacterium]MDW8384020.1 tetratricopeptide repeat protein [Flammeovirgaceae bacterium]
MANTFDKFLRKYLFFVLLFHYQAIAQYHYTENISQTYLSILNLEEKKARQELEQYPSESRAWKILLENYLDVLPILLTDNLKDLEKKQERQAERLSQLENFPQNSPYYLFFQAEIRAHWAMVYLKIGQPWSAFYEFSKAYYSLTRNQRLYPHFIPTQKTLGFFQILLGCVPEKYKWIATTIGLKGTIYEGKKMLRDAIQQNEWYSKEAQLLLVLSEMYLLNISPENFIKCDASCTVLEKICNAMIASKKQRAFEVKKLLNNLPFYLFFQVPYVAYMRADAFLQTGEYDSAIRWFEYYLNHTQTTNYIKASYFKLFLCSWFLNRPDTTRYKIGALQQGSLRNEADKYAFEFFQTGRLPNKNITQARFFTDGGEYEKALNALSFVEPQKLSLYDLAEYYYRYARIYHAQKQYDKAFEMYQKAIKHGKHLSTYFAANSDLQLGILCMEIKKDTLCAIQHLKQTLSYKKHEYKTSLDAKAQNLLQKIQHRE